MLTWKKVSTQELVRLTSLIPGMVRSLQTSQFNLESYYKQFGAIHSVTQTPALSAWSKLIVAAWTGLRMSPNDSAITGMEIELPHQHSTAPPPPLICALLPFELVATLVSGSGSGSDELRACLFTLNYPFLLAQSQLISRLPAERRQHWASGQE